MQSRVTERRTGSEEWPRLDLCVDMAVVRSVYELLTDGVGPTPLVAAFLVRAISERKRYMRKGVNQPETSVPA